MITITSNFKDISVKSSLQKKKEKQLLAKQKIKSMQTHTTPVKAVHYCYPNRKIFLTNFIYSTTFNNNIISTSIPYKAENLSVPIQTQEVKLVSHIVLYKNKLGKFSFINSTINISDYGGYLKFTNDNNIPIIIKSLNMTGCQIEIDANNCISAGCKV